MNAPVILRTGLQQRTRAAPHVRNAPSVDTVIGWTIVASLPALVFGIWDTGSAADPDAGAIEVLWAGLAVVLPRALAFLAIGGLAALADGYLRQRKSGDWSWLLVSWMMLLLLPVEVPLWQGAFALAFSLTFGLFVFGGYGMAPIHPVVAGGVFLALTFGDPGRIAGGDTALGSWYTTIAAPGAMTSGGLLSGSSSGGLGTGSPLWILVGGVTLVLLGNASWRTLVAGILGVIVTGHLLPFEAIASAHHHLLLGQFLFVLVFLAADPGAQALTATGRWIAGFSFGALTVVLRVLDPAHPEASLAALLLVSLCTPLADALVVRWAGWRRRRRLHG